MAEVLSENPAKLYGAYPRKGAILPGSDADIVVYDPDADTTVCAADMISAAEYTPYEGMRTDGGITQVYLRGTRMVEDGKVVGGQEGQYLRRGLCSL